MAQSVLGSVSLGYQLLWNQLRQLAGVQLFIAPVADSPMDAVHLLGTLKEMWPEQAPQLLLSVQSVPLFRDILAHGPTDSAWIEVPQAWLEDPALAQQVHQAQQRGMTLIWRGDPGQRPSAALSRCFARTMVTLTPEEALTGLRVSLRKHHGASPDPASAIKSPVQAGQIYEAVASKVLAEHCLDQQGAWGVAGWPMEDVLHGYRHQLMQPSQHAIVKLIEATDAEASIEALDHALSEEPILAYRFLRYANSAGLGLRTEIESLRHGLMVLGLSLLRTWLLEQLPYANSELNLQPIRSAMVMRARLMEHLLDAGEGDDLRHEIYMCGLFSQIDMLLGEPLGAALQRLPLPERTVSALLTRSGPYAPYLDLATAMESPDTQVIRQLCGEHEMSSEDVNRALLRTLSTATTRPAKGSLLG
jgi:EAL and modified HD-GYP domain-containing signal transduction protein